MVRQKGRLHALFLPKIQKEMMYTQNQPQTLSIELPSKLVLHVTQEQFEALVSVNRDIKLERTSEGELIVNPPTGGESGRRNLSISTQLGNWFEAQEELGEAFDSSTGFRLPNGADRSPDASWVSRERWESLTSKQRKGFVPLCPDFVVELRSDPASAKDVYPAPCSGQGNARGCGNISITVPD